MVCSVPLKSFAGFHKGYKYETCSKACAALDERRQRKTRNTMLERHGVEHTMHLDSTKDKIKDTVLTRYGVNSALKLESVSSGLRAKFGDVSNISQTALWKEKTNRTFDAKFGGRGFSGALKTLAAETLAKELGIRNASLYSYQQLAALVGSKRKILEQGAQRNFEVLDFDAASKTITLKHSCGVDKKISLDSPNRWRCLSCAPLRYSRFETEVADFIRSCYTGAVILQDRKLIHPLELDIVLPEKSIALECNGDYWHSYDRPETKIEREKHLQKMLAAKAVGLSLVQIAEHEWREKREIVQSIIAVKLGVAQTIFARKTTVKRIPLRDAHHFCEEHHIQGKAPASMAIALLLGDELVAVMTLGKNRFTKSGLELIRFACKKNTIITGGFTKLLKAIGEIYPGQKIESYLDRRLFDGHSLVKNGWQLERTSAPGYCWLLNGTRVPRSQTQKHRLVKILGTAYNPQLTEAANMFAAGATRLWDCGQDVFSIVL